MMNKSRLIIVFSFLVVGQAVQAQDIFEALESETAEQYQRTIATFKGTRISVGQSVETRQKGSLEIAWNNRFWNRPIADNERTQTFAADKWNSRIGIDYSLTDRFTAGIGYGTGYRSVDLSGKYRLFYQKEGKTKFPFSITLFQGGVFRGKSSLDRVIEGAVGTEDKFAATTQILIARKFSRNFSAQLAPSFIYRGEDNVIEGADTGRFALGFGARYKVSNHVSIVSEYYYVPSPITFIDTFGPFSLGANWEVSKLLLSFKLTNARNLVEDKFIVKSENNFNFRDGNLHFGFGAIYFLQL
jgi:opacity protein-like surface antigen